jgi:hypothetical protein
MLFCEISTYNFLNGIFTILVYGEILCLHEHNRRPHDKHRSYYGKTILFASKIASFDESRSRQWLSNIRRYANQLVFVLLYLSH